MSFAEKWICASAMKTASSKLLLESEGAMKGVSRDNAVAEVLNRQPLGRFLAGGKARWQRIGMNEQVSVKIIRNKGR